MRERKKGWTDGALLLGIGVGRSGERLLCYRGYSGDDSEVLPAITTRRLASTSKTPLASII